MRITKVIVGGALGLALLAGALSSPAAAVPLVLTFEGLQNTEDVNAFYNGGTGSLGSGPGTNFGIQFSNAVAFIDSDAGGTGNFGGEPSPSTAITFLGASATTMNVAAGFDTGFSFFYSAIAAPRGGASLERSGWDRHSAGRAGSGAHAVPRRAGSDRRLQPVPPLWRDLRWDRPLRGLFRVVQPDRVRQHHARLRAPHRRGPSGPRTW